MLARAGDTVRIVVEGVTHLGIPRLPEPGGSVEIIHGDKVTVEVVQKARPTFQPGDVIWTSGQSHILLRAHGGGRWRCTCPSGNGEAQEHVDANLTQGTWGWLVRGGKVVPS